MTFDIYQFQLDPSEDGMEVRRELIMDPAKDMSLQDRMEALQKTARVEFSSDSLEQVFDRLQNLHYQPPGWIGQNFVVENEVEKATSLQTGEVVVVNPEGDDPTAYAVDRIGFEEIDLH